MDCRDVQHLMHGYVDGELDLISNLEIDQHLQACPTCAAIRGNLSEMQKALHADALYFKAPAHLSARVRSSLHKAQKTRPARPVMSKMPVRRLAVAALLLFVLTAGLTLLHFFAISSPDEALMQQVVASHIRSLMANHLVDVASTDQHTVKPWFDGKLDFSPQVVDLASKGFPLQGGRLDYLDNQPVAALVYRYQKHIINLFIWPLASGEGVAAQQMTSRQGYNVIYWSQSGMNYWAVSDVGEAQLQQFVRLIQNQAPSTG